VSGCGGGEKSAVFVLRGASWTDGAAVDAGGFDAYKHQAIEARIARLESPVAGRFIRQFHP
jgi:hypothetical protein